MEYLISCIVAFIGLVVVLFILYNKNRRSKELKTKTDFAVQSEELIKVEMSGDDIFSGIAQNFNKLGSKVSQYKNTSKELTGVKEEKLELDSKIKSFEDSLSQMNLLTDIGKQITSSITIKDIAFKLSKNINSTMMAEEVSLLIMTEHGKKYYHVFNQKIEEITDTSWIQNSDNILNWSFKNNKEAFLNHASKDYAQYVFKPLYMLNGNTVESMIAVPLSLSNKMIGAVSIACANKESFTNFHLDFARSIASYVSVAIYNANLYEELDEEKQKSEELLLNILPAEVAKELKVNGKTEAKQYENVSVLFTDFMNFTGITEKLTPKELVTEIDKCFRAFDEITERNGLEKIKTIGDAYLAVCGLPHENKNHAIQCIKAAKEMLEFLETHDTIFKMRVGINSGPVVAGIVGYKKYAYDIWGDTVNTAARMEENGEPGKINISGSTFNLVKSSYNCSHRGKLEAKNKGMIDMYFIEN